VLMPGTRRIGPEKQKVRAVLWPSRYVVHQPAARLTATAALLGSLTLDFSAAEFPLTADMRLFVRLVGGRVGILFPKSWTVLAGDLTAAHGVKLAGELSGREPHEEYGGAVEEVEKRNEAATMSVRARQRLHGLLQRLALRGKASRPTDGAAPVAEDTRVVVLNIAGMGGSVTIQYR